MRKREIVNRFKETLIDNVKFEAIEENEHVWKIQSATCVIKLLFEQYDDEYSIQIQERDLSSDSKPMNILLLRFIRHAHNQGSNDESPEFYGSLFNNFFPDLLKGDFSIRTQYEALYSEFYTKFFKIHTLAANDPIRIKANNFDISWMKDLE